MKNNAAIIIVNWNGKRFLKDCLDSIYKQTYSNFDIYFVDNGSKDDSIDFIKKNYLKVKIIKLDKNYGFAKGNNEGIKEAFKDKEIKYIVCLNNDTITNKNWLKELIKTAEKEKQAGSVGSKILFYYEKNKINSLGVIPLKTGGAINYGKNELSSKYEKEEDIFGPCAGSALYKREALEKAGLFDEDYFCYLEDVDLAWRLKKAGYKSIMNPKSIVYHIHSGTSSNNNNLRSYLIVRNGFYNLIKHGNIKDILLYPKNIIGYYKEFKNKDNIGKEVQESSKVLFLKNHIKAMPLVMIKLTRLVWLRNKVKKKNGQKIFN